MMPVSLLRGSPVRLRKRPTATIFGGMLKKDVLKIRSCGQLLLIILFEFEVILVFSDLLVNMKVCRWRTIFFQRTRTFLLEGTDLASNKLWMLKEALLHLVVEKWTVALLSDWWKSAVASHPQLNLELMRIIVHSMQYVLQCIFGIHQLISVIRKTIQVCICVRYKLKSLIYES